MENFQSLKNFEAASHAVLSFLHQRLGFNLWMVTRTEADDWIVLQSEDHGYGVKEGSVFRWTDSFCSQMVLGRGPRVAPCSQEVPAYAAAPIGRQVPIGAYVGVPLTHRDGTLFGTLCAIDPSPQPSTIVSELPMIELLAQLLSTVLEAELKVAEQVRRAERAEADALTDGLTGLYNRRAWDQLLATEEGRCRRYGHPATVVAVDLDGLKEVNDNLGHAQGDELIRRAADALRRTFRDQDVVARVGGDEFLVLAVECDAVGARSLMTRVEAAFSASDVEASLGIAVRDPRLGLTHAVEQADEAMYCCKRTHRTARSR